MCIQTGAKISKKLFILYAYLKLLLGSSVVLMVQTLQATSYNGVFIWPKVQRHRHEAKVGRTVSLYSAPFYTMKVERVGKS